MNTYIGPRYIRIVGRRRIESADTHITQQTSKERIVHSVGRRVRNMCQATGSAKLLPQPLIKPWRTRSDRAQATIDGEEFNKSMWLWRGMKDMTLDLAEFMRVGGTEMAPMSTSASKEVAFK